jgi:hypothetical protein
MTPQEIERLLKGAAEYDNGVPGSLDTWLEGRNAEQLEVFHKLYKRKGNGHVPAPAPIVEPPKPRAEPPPARKSGRKKLHAKPPAPRKPKVRRARPEATKRILGISPVRNASEPIAEPQPAVATKEIPSEPDAPAPLDTTNVRSVPEPTPAPPAPQPEPEPQARRQKRIKEQHPPGQPLSLPVSVAAIQGWLGHVLGLDVPHRAKAFAAYISITVNRKGDGKAGYAHPSTATMRTALRMGVSTIVAAAADLEAAGALKVKRPAKWVRGEANEYWPLMPARPNPEKDDNTDPHVGPYPPQQPGPNTDLHMGPYSGEEASREQSRENYGPDADPLRTREAKNTDLHVGDQPSTSYSTEEEYNLPPSAASPGAMRAFSPIENFATEKKQGRSPGVSNGFLDDHTPIIAMIRSSLKRSPEKQHMLWEKIRAEYSDDTIQHAMDCLRADGTIPPEQYPEDECIPTEQPPTPPEAPPLPDRKALTEQNPDFQALKANNQQHARQTEAEKRRKSDEWLADYHAKRHGKPQ